MNAQEAEVIEAMPEESRREELARSVIRSMKWAGMGQAEIDAFLDAAFTGSYMDFLLVANDQMAQVKMKLEGWE